MIDARTLRCVFKRVVEIENRLERHALQTEQLLLDLESAAVACERAPLTHDSVARDNDRDWIPVIGLAYRAERAGPTHLAGKIRIRTGCAIGNAEQRIPALLLKHGSLQV